MKSFFKKYLGFIYPSNGSENKPESKQEIEHISHSDSNPYKSEVEHIPFVFQSAVQEEEGYEAFARYLSIRIVSTSHLETFSQEAFFVREDIADTLSILVLDYPSSIEHLVRANAAAWDKTEEELFERALRNVQETYHRVVKPYEGNPQAGMLTLSGNDAFKTTAILYLEEYPALQGAHGALVALPDKDTFICKTIDDDISLEVGMQFLVHFTDEVFHHSESAISKQIYWYINGELIVIPYNIGFERMNYVLPFDLEDRLY